MVSVTLPETRLIAFGELKSLNPLGGLPKIQMRNKQPRGTSVVWFQCATIVPQCDHRLSTNDIRNGNIRRIPVERVSEQEGSCWLNTNRGE
jgi:hypothetical protein